MEEAIVKDIGFSSEPDTKPLEVSGQDCSGC